VRAAKEQLAGGEIAWLAVIPCALATALLVVALGPPLGSLLFPPLHVHFMPGFEAIRPKPAEQARYVLSLLAPLLVCVAVARAARRRDRPATGATRAVVLATQLLALGLLAAALVRQHHPYFDRQIQHPYFSWAAVAFAVAFALAIVAGVRSERVRARAAAWTRETVRRRRACLLAAALFAALWLLTAINTDGSIGNAHYAVSGLLTWTADDVYAVLDGRTPLVDFHSQYGSLFPYASALPLLAFGSSLLVLTTFMAAVSGLTLLAVYDVMRRVTRSSVAALALFLPVVAIGFYTLLEPESNRFAPSNDFSWFPIRIAGPYVLAWLVVRHLDGVRPRRLWPIFLAAGLATLNNAELGAAALAATVAALGWTRPPAGGRALRAQLAEVAAGLAAAYALVAALTLVRAGSLPHLGYLTEYTQLYTRGGLGLQPIPGFGFHWVLYATYAAALVLATVRAVGGRRDPLTAMLAWSGVYGFGSAGYFVGEARYLHLIFLFSAWALALAMLLVAVLQALAARGSRRPTPAELAVLAAFGLAVCALAQTPAPWTQLDRIVSSTPQPLLRHNAAEQFVAADTRPGERAAILLPFGHRIAEDLGLVNVAPYSMSAAVETTEQLGTVVRALRAAHGTRVYCWYHCHDPGIALARAGFRLVRVDRANLYYEFAAG
jgi:hypothetical protein